ncbi:MazG nucleotide pyrophosphohydrolase domain-containing protein [Halocatena pleomorpha]|uniref:Nucleotide pyrophosphohydrolase n=1 Tax=Halocatena pleomorpha TaxID=1785090 RepID=A0A3P3RJY8_9EURY|nr:MazG nucleotide pyrophosphohydrolase domain-containing protein [Halocatena pleomorpha]RRJ33695.1 nucleotide pyrophosphohydrolase [Halocatena pleomorpha]
MDQQQRRVASFIEQHDLHAPPAYRLLDLVSEVGEVAKDANSSTDYGTSPGELTLSEEEIGDVLFSLLALADSQEINADAALQTALEKYERRLIDAETPSSE